MNKLLFLLLFLASCIHPPYIPKFKVGECYSTSPIHKWKDSSPRDFDFVSVVLEYNSGTYHTAYTDARLPQHFKFVGLFDDSSEFADYSYPKVSCPDNLTKIYNNYGKGK